MADLLKPSGCQETGLNRGSKQWCQRNETNKPAKTMGKA